MKTIAIDFDGTCVFNEYPKVGASVPYCVSTLQECLKNGNKLILFTMRDKDKLTAAINWFKENKISLWGINENPSQKSWSNSRKVYADIYIDDLALGCPKKMDITLASKPFVDWKKVRNILKTEGVI